MAKGRKRDILYPLLGCNSLPSARSISFLLEMEAASGFHGNLVVGGLQAPWIPNLSAFEALVMEPSSQAAYEWHVSFGLGEGRWEHGL